MKRCSALVIIMCFITASLLGCGKPKSDIGDDAIVVNIDTYGMYEVTEDNELDTTMNTTYTVNDETIAILQRGKYIYGLRPGSTRMEVTYKDKTSVYFINVLPNDNGNKYVYVMPNREVIQSNEISFGHCFNLLKEKELTQDNVGKECLFNWEDIFKSNWITREECNKFEFISYNNTSYDSFEQEYEEGTSGHVSIKLFGKNIFSKNFNNTTATSNNNSKALDFNRFRWEFIDAKYYLEPKDGKYSYYLSEKAREEIMGTDGTSVSQFIEKYGTHVIVSGKYGATFEFDYCIKDKNCFEKRAYVCDFFKKCFRTSRNMSHSEIELNEKAFYEGQRALSSELKQCDISWRFLGGIRYPIEGPYSYNNSQIIHNNNVFLISDIYNSGFEVDLAIEDFNLWYDSFLLDDGEQIIGDREVLFKKEYSYISPIDELSLVPVWELIDTSSEQGKKRKMDFIEYINNKLK